jgi:hypothetical protein
MHWRCPHQRWPVFSANLQIEQIDSKFNPKVPAPHKRPSLLGGPTTYFRESMKSTEWRMPSVQGKRLGWEVNPEWMGKKKAVISTVETIAFQWLKEAETENVSPLSRYFKWKGYGA